MVSGLGWFVFSASALCWIPAMSAKLWHKVLYWFQLSHPRWFLELYGWAKSCLDTDIFPLWILQFCPVLPGIMVPSEWVLHFPFIGLYFLVKQIYSFQWRIKKKWKKGGKHCGDNSSSSQKKDSFFLALPIFVLFRASLSGLPYTLLTEKWNAGSSQGHFCLWMCFCYSL